MMEGNKDEALRCIGIAKEAIAVGNKERALKFLGIARRLNQNLPLDDIFAACESLESSESSGPSGDAKNVTASGKDNEGSVNGGVANGERTYTEEHMHLVRQIKMNKDYYSILGLEKNCSAEEIRKAYRKLSLKVHPDKNKAPGSEEAFKKVSKAFKCLSDDDLRQQYDHVGLVDEFEHNQQYPARRRRRRTTNDFFDDEFDPDEIFRAFFGQRDVFRNTHVYRTRTHNAGAHQREDLGGGGPNVLILLQLLPFLIIILLAALPFSEPEYSLQRNYSYQFPKRIEKHGVDYFVKSSQFNENYPIGSPRRDEIENNVMKDYKHMLGRYCHMEMQRRHWNRHFPTPHCDRLNSLPA